MQLEFKWKLKDKQTSVLMACAERLGNVAFTVMRTFVHPGFASALGCVSSNNATKQSNRKGGRGGGGVLFPNVRVDSIGMGISETIIIVTEQRINNFGGQNFMRQDLETSGKQNRVNHLFDVTLRVYVYVPLL